MVAALEEKWNSSLLLNGSIPGAPVQEPWVSCLFFLKECNIKDLNRKKDGEGKN